MSWDLDEAIAYYTKQGAPADQGAVTQLLREVQDHHGGSVPARLLPPIAAGLGVRESLLAAIIRRIPSLRLGDGHCLELCAGPNCGRHTALAAFAERLRQQGITVRFVPCMRLCGKGPNIRFDGKLYHRADEALLRRLTEKE